MEEGRGDTLALSSHVVRTSDRLRMYTFSVAEGWVEMFVSRNSERLYIAG
jgi:hypothetical protein